jgi:hypothetical protein
MSFNRASNRLGQTTHCFYGRDPNGDALELLELKNSSDPTALA